MNETLEQLENDYWKEPEYDSYLVKTCHRLRKKPINEFSTEDLRVMISQNIGVDHLLPITLDILRNNPLAAGDFYEGDLLKVVIESDFVMSKSEEGLSLELADLCMRAMTQNAINEVHEPFGGAKPEEFGLDQNSIQQLLQMTIDNQKSQTPWMEFDKFFSKIKLQ